MGSPLEVRNSSITLALTRRLNFSNGTNNFLQHEKARVAAFGGYNMHGRRADGITMTNSLVDYTVTVGIGSPPTTYNLVVDSGSSVTWIGASTTYVKTPTSVFTGCPVMDKYGSEDGDEPAASFKGMIYRDTVTLGGLTVTGFQLGVASTSSGLFANEDGILGIGPEALSHDTMPLALDDTIPTFTDWLFDQGKITQRVVGIFFQPTTDPDNRSGELTFGRTDKTKYSGSIVYTPITTISPSSRYWGIKQRITYGQTEILDIAYGILDTGSNFIFMATDAYEKYKAATGGTLDPRNGLLRISPEQYSALENLEFHIEGQVFPLTPNAQIWPRSLMTNIHSSDPNWLYLIIADMGKPSGRGFDFEIGYTFMQRFYTVLDGSDSRVGFAKTHFTYATTN
ncbi:aspartic peptidase domain-containing protein [Suillus spraguei]|nr:aspartic peptidase domain-containing protein [Suillus spraguei]